MSVFMWFVIIVFPAAALGALTYSSIRRLRRGEAKKKVLATNLLAFVIVAALTVALTVSSFAAAADDAAPAADTSVAEMQETAESGEKDNSYMGLGLLAAGLVTGLAGIGGGIAVAAGAPAAIAATSEDAKAFGKSLIFVALGESIALYGVVISILILNKL